MTAQSALPTSAERLLAELAGLGAGRGRKPSSMRRARDLKRLLAAGFISQVTSPDAGKDVCASATATAAFILTAAGRAHLARRTASRVAPQLDPFRAQHLALERQKLAPRQPAVLVNVAESPVAWLGQRGLLAPAQVQAAERLRADFTCAQLLPQITLNWTTPVVDAPRGPASMSLTEAVVAARERVRRALAAAGQEFAGLLVDVCCFLKPLAAVERERRWPPRSGKVVLGLALAALARHYGLSDQTRGRFRAATRVWSATDAGVESKVDSVLPAEAARD